MKILNRFLITLFLSCFIVVCIDRYSPPMQASLIQETEEIFNVEEKESDEIQENEEVIQEENVEECKTEETEVWIEKPVFASGEFKPYMDGQAITDTTSRAYAQLQKMWIDENGCYREGDYVGIAVASFYGEVGDKFRITLSSGQVFYGVMTDTKQDCHVDENYMDANGGVIEFVVDIDSLSSGASTGSLNYIYEGSITKIERLENTN